MRELDELYRQVILDHNRNPRNFRRLEPPCACSDGINPLCGDRLRLCVHEREGVLQEVAFEGSGCAISIASASLLTETVTGLSGDEALALCTSMEAMLRHGDPAPDAAPQLAALTGVRAFPARIKCATLAWRALRAALSGERERVSTESGQPEESDAMEATHVRPV